jgi:two-component system, LytTR family, response regulator
MIRAIIIENEKPACESLMQLIGTYCTNVQVVATASRLQEAKATIESQHPDLVFLDVELDNETGFDLFKLFPLPTFDVVFTTAHEVYALKAIRYSCLDYLLKPIDFRELQQAVLKVDRAQLRQQQSLVQNMLYNLQSPANSKLAIPSIDGYEFFPVHDVVMACAEGNYTRIHTQTNQILSSRSLSHFEKILPTAIFFRCHKSYLINWQYVEKYFKNENLIGMKGGMKAELATRKTKEFLALIAKK